MTNQELQDEPEEILQTQLQGENVRIPLTSPLLKMDYSVIFLENIKEMMPMQAENKQQKDGSDKIIILSLENKESL